MPTSGRASRRRFVSVAELTETGLTIHTASQSPSFVRFEIARLLGWPENKVRVKVPYLGGGFGGKLYIKLEALVAALSLLTQRPVKISLTMEEQFYTLTKHAATFRIKSAVRNGKITGRDCEIWWNGGAYADIGQCITQKSGFTWMSYHSSRVFVLIPASSSRLAASSSALAARTNWSGLRAKRS